MSTISVDNRAKSSKAYGSGITTHQELFLTPCRQLGSTQSRPKVPEQQHSYYFNPLQPGKQQKALKFWGHNVSGTVNNLQVARQVVDKPKVPERQHTRH